MDPTVLYTLFAVVISICMIILPLVEVFMVHMEFPGFFEKLGLGPREAGLLLVGAGVGMASDIPIILHGGSLMALNLGGAVIPTVLSVYLVYKKKVHPAAVGVSVAVVAAVSFYFSDYRPEMGVVSEFPYFLLPALAAVGVALAVYFKDFKKAVPLAYAGGVLGTLVGADIVRIPLIFQSAEVSGEAFMGSIGGAGILDLVYLSGVLAFGIIILFAPRKLWKERAHGGQKRGDKLVVNILHDAEMAMATGRNRDALVLTLKAVDTKIRAVAAVFGYEGDRDHLVRWLGLDSLKANDLRLLASKASDPSPTEVDASRGLRTGEYLIQELEAIEKRSCADAGKRIGAFLLDALVIVGVLALLFAVIAINTSMTELLGTQWVFFVAFFMWVIAAQTVYFTALEWSGGQSLGKRVMHIKVVKLDRSDIGFMDAFTRNVVRLLDFALFCYLISAVLVVASKRRQRIGDMIAETVVINVTG